MVFNADHGELGGHHQMRGKGNCAYKEQNHIPLIDPSSRLSGRWNLQSDNLADRSCADADRAHRRRPVSARQGGRRPQGAGFLEPVEEGSAAAKADEHAAGVLCSTTTCSPIRTSVWAEHFVAHACSRARSPTPRRSKPSSRTIPISPSAWASAAFSMAVIAFRAISGRSDFNIPKTLEALLAKNDIELYDLQEDPDEMRNLAMRSSKETATC